MGEGHLERIVETCRLRRADVRYAARVTRGRVAENGYDLNLWRDVTTAEREPEVDPAATHGRRVEIDAEVRRATAKHDEFFSELGLPLLPGADPHPAGA